MLSVFLSGIYYFLTMQSNNNDKFEDSLQDILTSEDPNSPARPSQPINVKSSQEMRKSSSQQLGLKKLPAWLEMLIRIIAGIIILMLLFLFGMQVASR